MKCSVLLVALSGLLAAASPLQGRDATHRSGKRAVPCKARSAMPEPQPAPAPAPAPEPAPIQAAVQASAVTDSYSKAVLDRHNQHRQNHTVGALVWDNTLASYAQNIAATCVFAHDMKQGKGGYGQNIASYGSTDKNLPNKKQQIALSGVSDSWYSEINNWPASAYGQANPPSSLGLDSYGHWTQMVWKGSSKLGCASQLCPAGTIFPYQSWFLVCNYGSPGNVGGQYGQNVLPPQGLPTIPSSI